jgi:hypothetical protein
MYYILCFRVLNYKNMTSSQCNTSHTSSLHESRWPPPLNVVRKYDDSTLRHYRPCNHCSSYRSTQNKHSSMRNNILIMCIFVALFTGKFILYYIRYITIETFRTLAYSWEQFTMLDYSWIIVYLTKNCHLKWAKSMSG